MDEAASNSLGPFDRIFKLFTNKFTGGLVNRQQTAIDQLLNDRPHGFLLGELSHVRSLIELLLSLDDDLFPEFEQLLSRVVITCGHPFVRDKANAEYRKVDDICDLLLVVGTCLQHPSILIKVAAAEVLHVFAKVDTTESDKADGSFNSEDDYRPSTWNFNQQMLDQSGVVEIVAAVFDEQASNLFAFDLDGDGQIDEAEYAKAQDQELGNENPDPPVFMVSLMKMVFEMSSYKANALTLIRMGTPLAMARVAASITDFRKEEVSLMIQVLWNVMEHSLERLDGMIATTRMQLLDKYRQANAMYLLGNEGTVGMLRSLLERLLLEGHQKSDKELRNEVVIVSSLLASRKENHIHFFNTGFLSLLLLYGTAAEMELPTGSDVHTFSTGDYDDLEMKQLIWRLVTKLCAHEPANMHLFSDSLLLQCALTYIDPLQENAIKRRWTPKQLEIIQQDAFAVLFHWVPKSPKGYQELGGTAMVMGFLRTQQPDALVEVCLGFIRATCIFEDIAAEVGEQGGVQTMLDVICTPTTSTTMKEHAVAILSLVCVNNENNQAAFHQAGGPHALIPLLIFDPTNLASSETMNLEAVHCTWNAIVGNRKLECDFIQAGGIDVLFNLLEVSPLYMKNAVLGCLADILRNRTCLPYFAGWKSDVSSKKAGNVLVSLWIEIEKQEHLINEDDGVLLDENNPLFRFRKKTRVEQERMEEAYLKKMKGRMAHLRKALSAAKDISRSTDNLTMAEPSTECSQSAVALITCDAPGARKNLHKENPVYRQFLDMRARVYSLLEAAGFDSIRTDDLTPNEMLALAVIKRYPSFIEGAVWAEIEFQLADNGTEAISADRLHIDKVNQELSDLAETVKLEQTTFLEEEAKRDADKDEDFFNRILSQRDQELQFAYLNHTLGKSSGFSLAKRQENKIKKQEMLERSRLNRRSIKALPHMNPEHGASSSTLGNPESFSSDFEFKDQGDVRLEY